MNELTVKKFEITATVYEVAKMICYIDAPNKERYKENNKKKINIQNDNLSTYDHCSSVLWLCNRVFKSK